MWRDVSLSYRGALQILGRHDRPWLEQLDRLLGGGILIAGATSLAIVAPGPAAVCAAVWGWVDQKTQAMGLLRTVLDRVSDRLLGLEGYERHQLIAASHTTIVISSFFEVLGEKAKGLHLLDEERERLATGKWRQDGERLFENLYGLDVPIPSATCGYHENLENIDAWLGDLTVRTLSFFRPMVGRKALPPSETVQEEAVERYRTHFIELAATVPEFFVWASLGEHAATRHLITGIGSELQEAFQSQGAALTRIERLLSFGRPHHGAGERDVASVVARANRGALSEPVVPTSDRYDSALTVPTIEEIYVRPHCHFAAFARNDSRPASEEWWDEQRFSPHLDLLLTAHLTSPVAFQWPLLLLGHPGAGKSLLTKVLAARLPPTAYTVVRVPLRHVNADAAILHQIQAALDLATNGRVQWWEVAHANPQAVRVVLLDGLDELLQAASGSRDRRGYLQEIMDFQRTEGQQGFPVAVIVTSRTVVADRVLITEGTPIIKLDDFENMQITEWLNRWNEVNRAAVTSGRMREVPPALMLGNGLYELVKQPLLLLMLALYAADPSAAPIDAVMSTGALYRLLLNEFARREATKPRVLLSEKAVTAAVKEHLWRLTVAAFAMVNRGRQDITDAELGADLIALDERPSEAAEVTEIGRDLVAKFFFVHRAEARTGNDDSVRRCYEFLHATFGEYLVAEHIVTTLRTLAAMRKLSGRPVDDGFLHALLSHQPLSDRRQILTFAAELFCELSESDQEQINTLLEELVGSVRRRHDTGRHASYRPTVLDRVRHLAAYSLNLVLLRVLMARTTPVDIADLCGENEDPKFVWRSTVALWEAGLDPEKLDGVTAVLVYRDGFLMGEANPRGGWVPPFRELGLALLTGDRVLERRLRFGIGIHDSAVSSWDGDAWDQKMAAWLIPAMFSHDGAFSLFTDEPEPLAPIDAVVSVTRLIDMLLALHGGHLSRDVLMNLLDLRIRLLAYLPPDPAVLVSTLLNNPDASLVEEVLPFLDLDRRPHTAVLLSLGARLARDPAVARMLREAADLPQDSPYWMNDSQLDVLHQIIRIFRWTDDPTLPGSIFARNPMIA
ncbi:NACHT domain-containing protein [Nonomuraea spiralis]|uniref:NACHT domain-containing protein n=1 Tax=Nonomuraea spiralis TaxID=46182 RepID=UPI0037B7A15E